jgi:hypothetical protein
MAATGSNLIGGGLMAKCTCSCECCVARRVRLIYGLVDPRSGTVRYVGQARDPVARLAEHLESSSRRVGEWLAELAGEGLVPGVRVLEVVSEEVVMEREQAWISGLNETGPGLLNVAGTRPQVGPTQVISMRLPVAELAWLDAFAAATGRTRTDVIRAALDAMRVAAERGEHRVEVGHATC